MDRRLIFSCEVLIDLNILSTIKFYLINLIITVFEESLISTQTTEINSYISDKEVVNCGVPQGSVSWPLCTR